MKKLLTLAVFITLFSCSKNSSTAKMLQGEAFGTTYNIKYFSDDGFEAKNGLDSVIAVVNKSVNTYIPDSDISKINIGDSTIIVDEIFKEVFKLSEKVYKHSNGYFDPTIGVLRNAYGFGDTEPIKNLDKNTIDSLMQFVGFHKVKLNEDGTISKENKNIYFDFNAVAKGYGIDCLGRFLESKGVQNYLIELGGELRGKGKNIEKDSDWLVGIESAESKLEDRSYEATVKLENRGMASSGNYRKFRIDSLTGKNYVHTLNPLNGSAEKSDVTSATVLAETCAIADAYATAFMALGLEKSKTILKNLKDVEAYLTFNDSLNNHQVYITDGFKKYMPN